MDNLGQFTGEDRDFLLFLQRSGKKKAVEATRKITKRVNI